MFQYKSSFKDEYGDWHDWHSDTTVQHYLCRQLYLHYTQPVSYLRPRALLANLSCCLKQEAEMLVQEWADFLKPIKHMKGKTYLDLLPGNERSKVCQLCQSVAQLDSPVTHLLQRRELRNLLRRGVPIQYRTRVWSRCGKYFVMWFVLRVYVCFQSGVQVGGQGEGSERQCCWS